ncbi:hypothetical protein AHAS_Ahas02G0123500 [Arachis hypogaea]
MRKKQASSEDYGQPLDQPATSIQAKQLFIKPLTTDTGFIELIHNKDSTTKDTIFSKIKIMKVITLSE